MNIQVRAICTQCNEKSLVMLSVDPATPTSVVSKLHSKQLWAYDCDYCVETSKVLN